MYEETYSWHDNYLCTTIDIGLRWKWQGNQWSTDVKCVFTAEPMDSLWNDNVLCLPIVSPIELIWPYNGPVGQLPCISLGDPTAPAAFFDNYLCWKEHSQ